MISKEIFSDLNKNSWIRQMFEQGNQMRQKYGADQVYDFSLGNPVIEPPAEFRSGIIEILAQQTAGKHRYMSNSGLMETREYVADCFNDELSTKTFTYKHILMCVGAGGGLNVVFKSILNPGDEVIVFTPYFVEYDFYIKNYGGRLKPIRSLPNFQPDLAELRQQISYSVRVILLNSPNNPTGVVYSQETCDQIAQIVREAEEQYGHSIYIVSDEPYRKLIYNDAQNGSIMQSHNHSIVVSSHSKDYGLAGERIGYVVINPSIEQAELLYDALTFSNRVLGFVNAPALMQRVLPYLKGAAVSTEKYAVLRDKMCQLLTDMGYEFVQPQGAFFVFPKSPIKDDIEFMQLALKHRILVTPGKGFGCPGHFRISYSVKESLLEDARTAFQNLNEEISQLKQ